MERAASRWPCSSGRVRRIPAGAGRLRPMGQTVYRSCGSVHFEESSICQKDSRSYGPAASANRASVGRALPVSWVFAFSSGALIYQFHKQAGTNASLPPFRVLASPGSSRPSFLERQTYPARGEAEKSSGQHWRCEKLQSYCGFWNVKHDDPFLLLDPMSASKTRRHICFVTSISDPEKSWAEHACRAQP